MRIPRTIAAIAPADIPCLLEVKAFCGGTGETAAETAEAGNASAVETATLEVELKIWVVTAITGDVVEVGWVTLVLVPLCDGADRVEFESLWVEEVKLLD